MKKLNLSWLRILSFLTIMGLTVNVFGGSDPIWKATFTKSVKWMKVAPTGHLLVSTDEGLVGIDSETGGILWTREDLKGLKDRPEKEFASWLEEFVPFTSFAVLRNFSGAKKKFKTSGMPYWITLINVVNGQDMWTTETMGFKDHYGYYFLPEIGGMFLYAKDKNKKKTAFVVDLASGKVIWQKRDFFKKRDPAKFDLFPPVKDTSQDPFFEDAGSSKKTIMGNQPPLFDTDETMITFMNKKAIRKFNAQTGELIWETAVKAKNPPAIQNGYAPMLLDENGDVLYAACAKTVYAVRPQDGSLIWEKPPKLKGGVSQMRLLPEGLMVKGARSDNDWVVAARGRPFVAVIDLATGQPLWQKEYKKMKESTNFVIKDDKIVFYAYKKLYGINLADGEYTVLAEDLKFRGDEVPASLLLRDDGYLLQSSNNLMLVSLNGEKVFHTYHEGPGLSWVEKVAADIMRNNVKKMTFPGWKTDVEDLQRNYPQWMQAAWKSKKMEKDMFYEYLSEIRFKETKNRETYMYILARIKTENEKGAGLIKVNKFTGETEDQIILGTKEPVYEVDKIESRVFFKSGKQEIACYKF
ncbi:MAG: PQQ-binding-like beta-propeller repeat protein [bacterium]